MAFKRITDYATADLPLSGSELLEVDVAGVPKKVSAQDIADLATAGGGGSASLGVQYTSDTGSTTDSDPGAGLLKWNNAAQASATVLFLDDDTADGVSLTGWWSALDAGGFVYLQHATDPDTWQISEISTVTDASGYVKLAVTLLANGGSFADGDPMLVTLQQGVTSGSAAWGSITGTLSSQPDLQAELDARDDRGKHAVPIMAGAMSPSVTAGCAALANISSFTNNPDIQTLNFDASTVEYAQFAIPMPKSWNEGTVTFKPIWSHSNTTTNFGVVWQLQGVAMSDDDTILNGYGAAQSSTDTGGTTDDLYIGPESSAITLNGSPAAGDVAFFRISRLTTDGGDTMAIDARLHGIVLYMTTDAATDA